MAVVLPLSTVMDSATLWAGIESALALPCFCTRRAWKRWPAGFCRKKSTAASEKAHFRCALPILLPEYP